jgi:hypothetical protein
VISSYGVRDFLQRCSFNVVSNSLSNSTTRRVEHRLLMSSDDLWFRPPTVLPDRNWQPFLADTGSPAEDLEEIETYHSGVVGVSVPVRSTSR